MYKAKKSLGQNFLIDNTIINKIINSVSINLDEKIIEIGPGKGYLTKELKTFNTNLYAFEIDKDMESFLNPLIDNKTNIIFNDFLSIDLNDFFNSNDKLHVIANIPYYITTPIIEHIIESKLNILDMTLMVQKEVADRLSAKPGSSDYGYISVYLNYYFEINKLFNVDKTCFDPKPKVDSAIIQLKKRTNFIKANNEELFFKLIKNAFTMKRKNIRNNLKDYNLNKILVVLVKYNLDLTCRAEEIPCEVFVEIANSLNEE